MCVLSITNGLVQFTVVNGAAVYLPITPKVECHGHFTTFSIMTESVLGWGSCGSYFFILYLCHAVASW